MIRVLARDVTENDTETTISLVDLAVDEGSGTASVTATIANAPTDGPVVVTLDNGATITFAVGRRVRRRRRLRSRR